MKKYVIECVDANGEHHSWCFPRDKEGFVEMCKFALWLTDADGENRHEGYTDFNIK